MLDVFFPAPDDLHRPVDLLRDGDGLSDAVNVKTAAKATADKMIVHLDLFGRKPGDLCGRGLRPAHHLDSDPNIAAVLGDMHRAIHWLHGGVSEERHLIDGIDFFGDARYRLGEVAVAPRNDAFILRCARHLLYDAFRRDIRIRAVVPFDVERREPLHRRPHMVADHCDSIVDLAPPDARL